MEDETFKYFYDELIMSIITLSLPVERQIEIIGSIGCVGCEIVQDYDNFFTCNREEYILRNTFTEEQLYALDSFDLFLDNLSHMVPKSDYFYCDRQQLYDNPLWEEVRNRAKKLLIVLDKNNLDIEFSRTVEYTLGESGKKPTLETTKRRIVSK